MSDTNEVAPQAVEMVGKGLIGATSLLPDSMLGDGDHRRWATPRFTPSPVADVLSGRRSMKATVLWGGIAVLALVLGPGPARAGEAPAHAIVGGKDLQPQRRADAGCGLVRAVENPTPPRA
jgi:hypothetical protein